jgi:hypothetical protein
LGFSRVEALKLRWKGQGWEERLMAASEAQAEAGAQVRAGSGVAVKFPGLWGGKGLGQEEGGLAAVFGTGKLPRPAMEC